MTLISYSLFSLYAELTRRWSALHATLLTIFILTVLALGLIVWHAQLWLAGKSLRKVPLQKARGGKRRLSADAEEDMHL